MDEPIAEPVIIESPNFDKLRIECQEFVRYMSEEYHEGDMDDYENAIVEAALETFYGPLIYKWISGRIK